MRFETSVAVAAAPERVWAVLADVRRWPEWTASVRRVTPLDDDAVAPGRAYRVEQPRLRPAVWRVTDLTPGRSFTWRSRAGGVTSVGHHEVRPDGRGGAEVRLAVGQTGPLAPLVGLLFGRLTRRYLDLEAAGLKARAEG